MKHIFACIILAICLQVHENPIQQTHTSPGHLSPVKNLFIITIDGFRWQEIFTGADSMLINNEEFTPDAATIKMLYWCFDVEERRKKQCHSSGT
jgi:hypothetical protein